PATNNWLTSNSASIVTTTNIGGMTTAVVPPSGLKFTWMPPPISFAWNPSTGLSSTSIGNPKAAPPIGTTVYTVTATNTATGCSTTGTISLSNLGTGDPAPTANGT